MSDGAAPLREELAALAAQPDEALDPAEVALIFAALGDPGRDRAPYRAAVAALTERAGELARDQTLPGRVEALRQAFAEERYAGDDRDYDNLDNADLMRVIDRRRGLPVALGVLYLTVARRLGWPMAGLTFPAHFLVRLDDPTGHRAILDPFHGGRELDAAGLRDLLKALSGLAAELEPGHYAPVSTREVLVRLQNNIKFRRLRGGDVPEALRIVRDMLLFAPDQVMLWREAGLMHLRLDQVREAISALEQFVERAPNTTARHRALLLLQDLRGRL